MTLDISDAIHVDNFHRRKDGLYSNDNDNILHGYYKLWEKGYGENAVISHCWFKEGIIHNDFGPAYIREELKYTSYSYYNNDLLHRTDGPAVIYKYKDKNRRSEGCFYVDGVECLYHQKYYELAWDYFSTEQKKKYVFENFSKECIEKENPGINIFK